MSANENSVRVFHTETGAAVWEGGVISEGWECKALDVSNVSGAVVARVGGSLEWGGECGKWGRDTSLGGDLLESCYKSPFRHHIRMIPIRKSNITSDIPIFKLQFT